MVKENVYVLEEVGTGAVKLYNEASLAAMDIGVSVQHMWRCQKKNLVCKNHRIIGWKPRLYLVRHKISKTWVYELCTVDNGAGAFLPVNKGTLIKMDKAASVKDASELCYCKQE